MIFPAVSLTHSSKKYSSPAGLLYMAWVLPKIRNI